MMNSSIAKRLLSVSFSCVLIFTKGSQAETSIVAYTPETRNSATNYERFANHRIVHGLPSSPAVRNRITETGKSIEWFTGKLSSGRFFYNSRCTLCHGKSGRGDGPMAAVMKDPSPADLSKSILSKDEAGSIIMQGGKGVGRSPSMPPWSDELTQKQLDSLITYIFNFRK